MTETSAKEVLGRRLPLYAYLEPLLAGRRVLELGTGTGAAAAHLAAHGAIEVLSVDTNPANVERARVRHDAPNLTFLLATSLLEVGASRPFDVVLVPEAEALLRRPEAIPALARFLADGGRLVLVATSADRGAATPAPDGVGYYELTDALLPHFPAVQMFGVTPFAGFGVVEFDVEGDGLRVDSRLVEGGAELPAAYVAVASAARAPELGYALVQVPFAPLEAKVASTVGVVVEPEDRGAAARLAAAERRLEDSERRARARLEEADGRTGDLRRKLEDALVQADSAMRITRAQGEEMEELRARLRRAGEDRAAIDVEAGKLRRALAEADESVMSLTRRTAEEMSAVAQRLAAGLREAERPVAARDDSERLRIGLTEAEARAAAAERRLEEVAAVGRERQAALDDVVERLRLSEDLVTRERAQVARLQAEVREAGGQARAQDDSASAVARRDERIAALEGEKQELTWRLAELEEKLRTTIRRAVVTDSTGRAQADELDAARASRARALDEFHRAAGVHVDELTALRASVAEQTALVTELEESLRLAEAAAAAATTEAAALRKNAKGLEESDRTRRTRLAELEGKLLRLEHERKQAEQARTAAPDAAGLEALERRAGELERARDDAARDRDDHAQRRQGVERERDELRGNLARLLAASAESAEALARSTGELGQSRARVGALEAEVARLGAARPAAVAGNGNGHAATSTSPSAATARELHAIEAGLREELASLTQIESALAEELASAEAPAARPVQLVEDQSVDAILLHATLGNYRRHAARLRDELEGVRQRLDSLTTSEISGYLEELGEDLAEMEE